MAAKGASDNPNDFEVCQDSIVEMKLILPDGRFKQNYRVKIDTTVKMEKERIWELENVKSPPADRLMFVLLLLEGAQVVMEDDKEMKFYTKQYNFGVAELKLVERGTEGDRIKRRTRPEIFGVKPK